MSTVPPPPSKRQKREAALVTQVQKDVTAIVPSENAGSFTVRFVDGDGKQTDSVEIPLADADEKNVSLLFNTLLVSCCSRLPRTRVSCLLLLHA